MKETNGAIPIGGGYYWVGSKVLSDGLQCNPYMLIDGEEATLKEFRRDAKGVWLIPHNPDLSPVCLPPERVLIQGALVGVMRSC